MMAGIPPATEAPQRFSDPLAGRLDASNQFHKNVGVRGKHLVDAFRPAHTGGNPIHFFPGHFAIENVGQLKAIIRFLTEQLGDGLADGAKASKSDLQPPVGRSLLILGFQLDFELRFRTIHFCRQFITSLGTGTGFVFP
jgi:hypothetical protein